VISAKTSIPPSLIRKLSRNWVDNRATNLVNSVANATLWNIREYGFGVAKSVLAYPNYDSDEYDVENRTPSGGAPIWQGEIKESGHYRGYLSESHYVKSISPYHAQIVTPAEFVWGVIEGYSTNGNYRFPENPYHKRAVDKMYRDNIIGLTWSNIMDK